MINIFITRYKLFFLFLFFPLLVFSQPLTDYVNPFIGTTNGGNTFPGAVVPWGMVSVSPHNAPGSPSGYLYGESNFYGLGHTHLSGTGCSDLGSIIITAVKKISGYTPDDYRTSYTDEKVYPGYYSVYLPELKLRIEAAATTRCGFIKITPDEEGTYNILIDAGRSLNLTGGGSVNILSDTEIEGSNTSGGFCGEVNRQDVFFSALSNIEYKDAGLWLGNKDYSGNNISAKDTSLGCWLEYDLSPDIPLLIKVGISYVSTANAKDNLQEIPDWNFNEVKEAAAKQWENILSRIIVTDTNKENKIKFYSALYHMLIHPNIINDINGEYPLMGRKGTGKDSSRHYTIFSLWDTYRTLHPFLTLVYPEYQSEMINTMLDMYKENGYLPKWELTGLETYMMVGDPAPIVIADSYVKGIKDFDVDLALKAMLKPVMLKEGQKAPPIRAGYHELLQYGYIPFEQNRNDDWWVWGPVSTTLEYNLSDWAIGQFAKAANKIGPDKTFQIRSHLYKNLFDSTTLFMRPKLKNGSWLTPFDSLATEGSGDWGGSGGPGYVEGNAWNYTWFVPHDIKGLINLFGSEEKFREKLLRAFKEKHFTINNEPDFAYPYLFNYLSEKDGTTEKLITGIINNEFGTGPGGLPGNDDCGTTSGWLVFSALGFYPACPALDEYITGIPLFDKVEIKLNKRYYEGNSIIIEKQNKQPDTILLNGKEMENSFIKHSDLVKGSRLIFK